MNHFKVFNGSKGIVDAEQIKLGERAALVGELLLHRQMDPRGKREDQEAFSALLPHLTEQDLLSAFTRILPGMGESIITAITPILLAHLGRLVAANMANKEIIAFLSHILGPKKKLVEEPSLIEDIKQIREDLALISGNWVLALDPDGNFVDVEGTPKMPTSMILEKEGRLKPQYDKVNIATVYLEEPRNELELNARFIALAPGRIRRLLELLDEKARPITATS